MKKTTTQFKKNPMSRIKLSEISSTPPPNVEKSRLKKEFKDLCHELDDLQHLMYAQSKHSLLIILQGIDAAGKDGLIRDVFKSVNPLGVKAQPFKKPTDEEMAHDFLWRIHKHAPEKGMIQIFNRSHYEDVLIQRVHEWIDMDTVKERYVHINNFEKLLQANGTHVLKFYLHVSHAEQLVRLKERLINPKKNWKYNPSDMEEREHWDDYMKAYEDIFHYCSPEIPWTILPADKNWYKEYLFAKKVVELMRSLNMKFPRLDD
ncbi:MAG: polyphosphate kinase [Chitinophagales bacterium]|nr:polyphosphate kinase [Chitinophagales bacterium]